MTTLEARRRSRLDAANDIRTRRAALKLAISQGRVSLSEALQADHEWTQTMRVADLLRVTPKLGPVRVDRALRANRIRPSLSLEHFPSWRREQLLAWITLNCPKASVYPKGEGE